MSDLTARQAEILDYIRAYPEGWLAITLDEIGDACGCNKSTAYEHIRALIRKGYLEKRPHQPALRLKGQT